MKRRTLRAFWFAAALSAFCNACATNLAGAAAAPQPPDPATVSDAYVNLPGRALVIRQETIDRQGVGFAHNKIKDSPSADFVNATFDIAYLEAWFAVDDDSAQSCSTFPRCAEMRPDSAARGLN